MGAAADRRSVKEAQSSDTKAFYSSLHLVQPYTRLITFWPGTNQWAAKMEGTKLK